MHSDIRTAVYSTVHEFPARRGLSPVESAAQAIGRAPGTVYNKADPGNDAQGFTIDEALMLIRASGDTRILHAFAFAVDHAAVRLGDFRRTSDVELLDLLLRQQEAAGRRAERIRIAISDGLISTAEMDDIRGSCHAHLTAELELVSRLEGLADAARSH